MWIVAKVAGNGNGETYSQDIAKDREAIQKVDMVIEQERSNCGAANGGEKPASANVIVGVRPGNV